MNYNDGPHDARRFLRESTRPKPFTEADKMVQFFAIKPVSRQGLIRVCNCNAQRLKQNCWNCVPDRQWPGPDVKSMEKIHTFSADYSQIVPRIEL